MTKMPKTSSAIEAMLEGPDREKRPTDAVARLYDFERASGHRRPWVIISIRDTDDIDINPTRRSSMAPNREHVIRFIRDFVLCIGYRQYISVWLVFVHGEQDGVDFDRLYQFACQVVSPRRHSSSPASTDRSVDTSECVRNYAFTAFLLVMFPIKITILESRHNKPCDLRLRSATIVRCGS